MSVVLPYVTSYGLVEKVLGKIKAAQTPDRFTQDYLGTNLGMSSGPAMALIPLLKKIGFLGSDGVPTDFYKKFRNENFSKVVMGQAIKHGYKELYSRNEYAHKLSKEKLTELVKEITGAASDSSVVRLTVGTYEALKKYAEFDEKSSSNLPVVSEDIGDQTNFKNGNVGPALAVGSNLGFNLAYTINLNLPATTDVAVFNAIFKSLKENLLQREPTT
jgi:hypothetical protein